MTRFTGRKQRFELDHPTTHRKFVSTHVRCPRCQKSLDVVEYDTTRTFNCSSRDGCGYTFDENIANSRGDRRGGR